MVNNRFTLKKKYIYIKVYLKLNDIFKNAMMSFVLNKILGNWFSFLKRKKKSHHIEFA